VLKLSENGRPRLLTVRVCSVRLRHMPTLNTENSRYAVAFEPNVGQRTYAEITAKLSVPAACLLFLLSEFRTSGPIALDEIAQTIARAEHIWSSDQVPLRLSELRDAGYIRIVRRRVKSNLSDGSGA